MVSACCRSARTVGVRPGLPIAEARALFGPTSKQVLRPRFLPDDPQADRRALQKLAGDCDEFSPLVGIENEEFPSSLMLNISGCAACFGGEVRLVQQLRELMQGRGFHVHIGVADTIGAAWAVAHFRTRSQSAQIVHFGCQEQALRPLPIEALRLPPQTVRTLHDLDIRQVSQLLSLPRKSLPSRFGKELLLRIDQALGRCPESILLERRPVPLRDMWDGETPLPDVAALDVILARLVDGLMEQLRRRGEGLLGLDLELRGEGRSTRHSLALLRPTMDCRHVMNLLRLGWERLQLPDGLTRVQIEVRESGILPAEQQRLWQTDDSARQRDTAGLIEKLGSRLGCHAVLRPVVQAEQQPELAFALVPKLEFGNERNPARNTTVLPQPEHSVSRFRLSRPLWLKRKPVPVEVVSVVPNGPPYRLFWRGAEHPIACCWGPERITTGWWRGEHVKRDYYHVETADGNRLWLFRDWKQGRWFLHAVFD